MNSAPQAHSKSFDEILLNCVDESFSALGSGVKDALYHSLETKFLIAKPDIPNNIEGFSDALEKIFGCLGARSIEILLMKKLGDNISCNFEWRGPKWLVPNLTLCTYVELLRTSYEEAIRNMEIICCLDEEKGDKMSTYSLKKQAGTR
jgi:hypothetical protein